MMYYYQAKELSDKMSNTLYQSLSQKGIGSTFVDIGEANEGINYCENGLRVAIKIQTVSVQQDTCDCLYKTYKMSQQNTLALSYLEQSISLKDSLQSRQTADKILNMEFDKKILLDSIAHKEKEQIIQLTHQEILHNKEKKRNIIIAMLIFIVIVSITIWSRLNYIKKSKKVLQKEKDRSEHLLLNILPEEIANELKSKGFVDTQDFMTATILFTDFKSFTATASQLNSQDLVVELNTCFKAFDHIIGNYGIEKIKTIGDAYMAAGGVPIPDASAVNNTILAALEMQEFIMDRKTENDTLGSLSFEMLVGIHSGPIVAGGIVGVKKFQYDILYSQD